MTALTLEEFRATRQYLADVRAYTGDDTDEPTPGYTYSGACCICVDKAGDPFLVIYNMQWSDRPLEELEQILYEEFYLSEIAGESRP